MSGMYRDRIDPVKQGRLRLAIQVITAVFLNGYAAGFAGGKIYAGDLKKVCVPVLNCYSCPGAVGSCPIGALQTMLGSHGRVPFYVLGLLMLFGILLGRAVCGFLCPFGLVQDLLAKIPVKKLRVPGKIDRLARYLKYVVLALLLLIPVLSRYGEPVFCKYLCPAGTLEAGIPLMIADPALRALRGALFHWKITLLIIILVSAVFVPRCFCRYLCPLGAFYSFFQKFSFYQMEIRKERCVECHQCDDACPMDLDVTKEIRSVECIRCGRCRAVCPEKAIRSGWRNLSEE